MTIRIERVEIAAEMAAFDSLHPSVRERLRYAMPRGAPPLPPGAYRANGSLSALNIVKGLERHGLRRVMADLDALQDGLPRC